jgi:hypothetical protein
LLWFSFAGGAKRRHVVDKKVIALGFGGVSVPLGSHIAAFYRDLKEEFSITVPFIKTGLVQGARCICVIDKETRDELAKVLSGPGVDVEAALASGQLSILTTEETYLSEGYFSPEKMLDLWETILRSALEKGYQEIRITGEVDWILQEKPGAERLMEYETKLGQILPSYPHVTICLYNIGRLGGDIIMDALQTHPDCILRGLMIHNHFYRDPEEFLRELRERSG